MYASCYLVTLPRQYAEKQAREAQVREAQGSHKSWREWVRASNLGWKHRWSRVEPGALAWRPSTCRHQGAWGGRPTHLLAAETARLASIWDVSTEPLPPPDVPSTEDYLPAITLEVFQQALRRFSHHTARTYDGIHPKHLDLLSEEQQSTVISFLHLVEAFGALPDAIGSVVTVLIPKLKSVLAAFRGIGLLPGMYRVWSRCRQPLVRSWESSIQSPLIGHQKGRSITELVFLQSARAEEAFLRADKCVTAMVLWDLSSYQEFINPELLKERCLELKFPEDILRVMLAQQSGQRLVSLNGYVLEAGYPRRGIPAGDSFTTYAIQGYSLRPLQKW